MDGPLENLLGDHIALGGMLEHHRRKSAEIARLGCRRELDHVARLVAEHRKHGSRQVGRLADPVIAEQRFFQQIAAEARAAALVTDQKAPAADGAGLSVASRQVGASGTQHDDRPVACPDGALERNQRVALHHIALERQDRFQLLPVGAHIAAGETEHGRRLRHQLRVLAGIQEGQSRRLDDALPRAGQIGADIGGTAPGAPDDTAVCSGERGPATGAAAIDSENHFHAANSSKPDNTNKIPIAKR